MRLLLLLMPLLLAAEMLRVGDAVRPMTLEDQFGKFHRVGNEQAWVVTWDKSTTRLANLFFEQHPALLEQNRTALIVDVSQTPSGIMSLFVMPRMRSYGHTILMGCDEAYNRTLPYSEGAVTILRLRDGAISEVLFAEDEAALRKALLP